MFKAKKRFIAGAVCPRCSEQDTLTIFTENDKEFRECVSCGFKEQLYLLSIDIKDKYYERAVPKIEELLRAYPDQPETYHELGKLYYHSWKNEKAEECYVKALGIDESFFPVYREYALILIKENRFDEAENLLNKAKTLRNKEDADIYFYLGMLNQQKGNIENRAQRLSFLLEKLALSETKADDVVYQLVQRTASAVVEAGRFNAKYAVMIVQSFSLKDSHYEQFEKFVNAFNKSPKIGELVEISTYNDIRIFVGWARGNEKYLNQ